MKYKKILLISPGFNKGRFRLAAHPLAGLGYIAESLKCNGITVDVFDMNLRYNFRDLVRKLDDFSPDVIGLTAMTFAHRDVSFLTIYLSRNMSLLNLGNTLPGRSG